MITSDDMELNIKVIPYQLNNLFKCSEPLYIPFGGIWKVINAMNNLAKIEAPNSNIQIPILKSEVLIALKREVRITF